MNLKAAPSPWPDAELGCKECEFALGEWMQTGHSSRSEPNCEEISRTGLLLWQLLREVPTNIRDGLFYYIPKCLRDVFPLTPFRLNGNSPGPHQTHPWVWLQFCQLSNLCLLLEACGSGNDSKQLHVLLQGVGLGSKVSLVTEEGLPALLIYGLYLKQLQINMWQMLQGLKSRLLHTLHKALSCSGQVLCST